MRVLFFYPENPILRIQGNNSRVTVLLKYFQERGIKVDFVTERTSIFAENEIKDVIDSGLVENGFLLERRSRKNNQLNYFFNYSIYDKYEKNFRVFNRLIFGYKDIFSEIIQKTKYDFIFISYVDWSELIKKNKFVKKSKLILDTHDFLTSQYNNKQNINEISWFNLPVYFEKEINYLDLFDVILAISIEEKYLFSQFTNKKVLYIPHALKNNSLSRKSNSDIDVLLVASNNRHNVDSAKWFFEEVFPLIDSNIKFTVVGKVCNHIQVEADNLTKLVYVEDLEELYEKARICICPMVTGTGIKIKVVEALSYGLPVVCNERGVDGLLNKTNNGCLVTNDASQFAAYITKLLNDELFYAHHSKNATKFFDETLSTEVVYKKLDELFLIEK